MSSPTDSTDRDEQKLLAALDDVRFCGSPWCDREIPPDGAMCSPECLQDWRDWQTSLLVGSDA